MISLSAKPGYTRSTRQHGFCILQGPGAASLLTYLLTGALFGRKGRDALLRKSPDDVVITLAIRSPMCKAKKGGFKDTK